MNESTSQRLSQPTLVYLAGAIENALDGGEGWRRALGPFLRDELGWDVYDPTAEEMQVLTPEERKNFRTWKAKDLPRFQEAMRRVMEKDLSTLRRSDAIIVLWDEPVLRGGGTHGELTLAHTLGIPVHLVLQVPIEQVSSWILGCATEVHQSFEALKARLTELNGKALA
jgi:nucleoside 2-deoxyribosyltransferase